MSFRYQALLGLALLSLSGCGFHLRGAFAVPPWLQDVYIRLAGPADTLALELRQSLQANGVRVRMDAAQPGAVIELGAEVLNRRLLASNSGNHVKDYEFRYEVAVSVTDADGKGRLVNEKITVYREMDYDETQVLAKAAEQDVMKKEMARDAVRQIIHRLQARHLR